MGYIRAILHAWSVVAQGAFFVAAFIYPPVAAFRWVLKEHPESGIAALGLLAVNALWIAAALAIAGHRADKKFFT